MHSKNIMHYCTLRLCPTEKTLMMAIDHESRHGIILVRGFIVRNMPQTGKSQNTQLPTS